VTRCVFCGKGDIDLGKRGSPAVNQKADRQPEGIDRVARRMSWIIPLIGLGVTTAMSLWTFWYANQRQGELIFAKPNLYDVRYIGPGGNLLVTFPVSVANTGAVVHAVNFMRGRMTSEDGKWSETFYMCYEPQAVSPAAFAIKRYACSFAVGPGSSTTKLVAFRSSRLGLSLPQGAYRFSVYAWVDGRKTPMRTEAVFPVDVSEAIRKQIKDGVHGHVEFGLYLHK
jgi:hypothetical protein